MAEQEAPRPPTASPSSPMPQHQEQRQQHSGCLPCVRSHQISSSSSQVSLEKSSSSRPHRRSRKLVPARRLEDVPKGGEQEMSEIRDDTGQREWEHLVIMVNGIVGSASNWKFAAEKLKERYGDRLIIHCSACNSATETFHGVDVMGTRLAKEVEEVVKSLQGLQKISFVAHSLGGLVARYAIAKLYGPPDPGLKDIASTTEHEEAAPISRGATIAGLQPINFITVATPHLGSRGNQQLPFLCGVRCLEKVAVGIAHWFIGKTGRHLFLTDGKPPLLCRMVTDCEEGMFLSALQSFKRHVTYSNVDYDHMVGWRTSSLRRESELPKVKHTPVDPKYPHIICIEDANKKLTMRSPVEEVKSGPRASDPLEEEMLAALTKIPWERVDVSFRGSTQRLIAHSTIQVKTYPMHSDGADVIQHIIDHFLL